MGNLLACGAPIRVSSVGSMKACSAAQLVLADGAIESIRTPVSVAELMMEHPQHFVCHVNLEAMDFERDRPLPADARLEFGEIYYLRSKSALSSESKSPLRQLKMSSSDKSIGSGCRSSSASSPAAATRLFRMKHQGGVTQVTVSADFVARLLSSHHEEEMKKKKNSAGTESSKKGLSDDHGDPELQLAYEMRLVSRSVSWKPKLATIQES